MKPSENAPILDLVLAQSLTGNAEPDAATLGLIAAYRTEIERRAESDERQRWVRFMRN